jgi:hypothetical protein
MKPISWIVVAQRLDGRVDGPSSNGCVAESLNPGIVESLKQKKMAGRTDV